MSETTCLHCTATTSNGLALCQRCQATLTESCINVASYFADVQAIKPGQRVKVRSAYKSTPPPGALVTPRDRISEECDYVATIVYGWCRNLEDDRPGLAPLPATTERRCGWLEAYLPSILTLEWAAECLREMLDCEHRLRRILDRADTGWYAGICGNEIGREWDGEEVVGVECPRELFVGQGKNWVTCPECGRAWDAKERRLAMREEAKDRTAPVRVLARIAVGLTDEASEERLIRRIEKWVEREVLTAAGTKVIDGKPRKVYRIGDVLDLIKPEKSAPTERIGA